MFSEAYFSQNARLFPLIVSFFVLMAVFSFLFFSFPDVNQTKIREFVSDDLC